MSEPLQTARELLADALGLSAAEVGEESTVHNLQSWDSLSHMRIVAAIEERTGATLEPEQILGLSSVKDIAGLLGQDFPSPPFMGERGGRGGRR